MNLHNYYPKPKYLIIGSFWTLGRTRCWSAHEASYTSPEIKLLKLRITLNPKPDHRGLNNYQCYCRFLILTMVTGIWAQNPIIVIKALPNMNLHVT